ncbi:HEL079Cp [Eremothecium sinecaudum]|uniref:AP complex subunit beta n=1 Tax=Eremothecium sinecaudum TaxID=45286 RepID=A0A0X8HTJ6_9SACH|nr:HEL079Cp [Eremothecium sinecaudum]AMD21201.1 HEL079Cp [Eremothecium sinecaudum]
MTDNQIYATYSASEILKDLNYTDNSKMFKIAPSGRKVALKKIISNLNLGKYAEMLQFSSDVINILATDDDITTKYMCCEYLLILGPVRPSLVNEALPYLADNLQNSRSDLEWKVMVFNTLVTIGTEDSIFEAFKYALSLLNAKSSSIKLRRAVIKALPRILPEDSSKQTITINKLHHIIESLDENPSIILASLRSLIRIYRQSENLHLKISRRACNNIIAVIPRLGEKDMAYMVDGLYLSYTVDSEEEVNEVLKRASAYLDHPDNAVVLSFLQLITYYSKYCENCDPSITSKVSSAITALMEKATEKRFHIMSNIVLPLSQRKTTFVKMDIKPFFINPSDLTGIKEVKLALLHQLTDESTMDKVLVALKNYAIDLDMPMAGRAIHSIGQLATNFLFALEPSVKILMELLQTEVEYVIQGVIVAMRDIIRKYPQKAVTIVPILIKYFANATESESICAVLWITAAYPEKVPNSLAILNEIAYSYKQQTLKVHYMLLESAVKFYVKNTTKETELLCLHVLKLTIDGSPNPDLRDRGFFYWNLLAAAHQGDESLISKGELNELIDPELPEVIVK